MELIQVGKRTYYIKNPTNIGVYQISDTEVYLIDTGNDKEAGKKILKLIQGEGWTVRGIISTHSHADHIGGNQVIQNRTGCPVYAYGMETCVTAFPLLEPSLLYGGYPFKPLRNKFLMAKASAVTAMDNHLPEGLTDFSLPGHYLDMIGIKTDDEVYFLADALFSAETIGKYHVFFLYDVQGYLDTLDKLAQLQGQWFIPSHCEATPDISGLIDRNRRQILAIAENIVVLCHEPITWEDILKHVFDDYDLTMDPSQYVLVGSTIRSYLAYLHDAGRLSFTFQDNRMM